MRLSAPYFAEKLRNMGRFDRVLCSTFVDVATLRALAPAWINKVPVLTYFHENQFAYPVQMHDKRDFHFALTNVTTAMASDKIAFNSHYNRDTFLKGAEELIKKNADIKLTSLHNEILKKSAVIHPGIDFDQIDSLQDLSEKKHVPTVLWNHRWEHDKNPEIFFETLFALEKQNVDFDLVVAGQNFHHKPAVFEMAEKKLTKRIRHFGYIKSKKEYFGWLQKADHVVSTAAHEFFGIAVIEAVRTGCRPLLPNRLSYPELFPMDFLYAEDIFEQSLKDSLPKPRLKKDEAISLTERFSWKSLAGTYEEWLII
jgi:glycosyltransferase involved in cell wall biosynthesis